MFWGKQSLRGLCYDLIFWHKGRSCPVARVLCSWPEDPGSRLTCRKLPYTLMAPGACKIRRGCNVLQVSIQIILLGAPKRGSSPLRVGSKLRWHVSRSTFGMNPRPSAIAHKRSSNPTLNPYNLNLNLF